MYSKIFQVLEKGYRAPTFSDTTKSNRLRSSGPDYLIAVEDNKYTEAAFALSRDRIIFLCEDITKEVAASLCALLIYYNGLDPKRDIYLFIHTNGGEAAALASIYDVMSLIEAPVNTIGMGKVYSAGTFLLAAGAKGKRFLFRNAEILIHGLQCAFPEVPLSDQIDSSIYYKYLEDLNIRILKILAKHTKKSLKKITEDAKRDLYLDAEQALKYGIIDEIL